MPVELKNRVSIAILLSCLLCFFLPEMEAQENYKDEVISNSQLEKTLLGIVLMYDQYEKECYADSSLHSYNLFEVGGAKWYGSPNMIDPGFNAGWKGLVDVWEHREPTFRGFIEWLRKLGKK